MLAMFDQCKLIVSISTDLTGNRSLGGKMESPHGLDRPRPAASQSEASYESIAHVDNEPGVPPKAEHSFCERLSAPRL